MVRESFGSHQKSKKRLRTVIWVGLVVGLVVGLEVRESFASHQNPCWVAWCVCLVLYFLMVCYVVCNDSFAFLVGERYSPLCI